MKGIIPIVEKFLLPNHLLALGFKEGWVFARVARRRIMHYKPYSLINSSGTTVDVAASSAQGELLLRDSRNYAVDILYLEDAIDTGMPWILHGAIGWKPQYIMVYPRIPQGKTIPGKFPALDPIVPSSGDRTGFYSGLESPYDEPTDFMEYVIPPKQHISHEFYNLDADRAHNPVANILFALYHLQIFPPVVGVTSPTNRIIRDIALRRVTAAFLTVGETSDPLTISDVQKDWEVAPISLNEASSLEA